MSALGTAVQRLDLPFISELLDWTANPEAPDAHGMTALDRLPVRTADNDRLATRPRRCWERRWFRWRPHAGPQRISTERSRESSQRWPPTSGPPPRPTSRPCASTGSIRSRRSSACWTTEPARTANAFAFGELGDERAIPALEQLVGSDTATLESWGLVGDEAADAIANIRAQSMP